MPLAVSIYDLFLRWKPDDFKRYTIQKFRETALYIWVLNHAGLINIVTLNILFSYKPCTTKENNINDLKIFYLKSNLNWLYRVLVKNNVGTNVTIINICANHYTKILVNHVYTYFQSETNSCKTVDKMKRNNRVWKMFKIVILLSPYKTVETKYAISTMKDKCNLNHPLSNESNYEGEDYSQKIQSWSWHQLVIK
ncbi:Uncharacterized protein FWK35_00014453 [Aphis craccivora]|uniref:Uncharacterized protein n=1 Tax=Aphis craccivora TaxID=307492 RepID=A0A6G0WWS0_APHCR|nr:Uncharacterized protein FWK35_00014453 [Aphis craccivora]